MESVARTTERPTIVCLLGMHRSGTSVIARLLNLLGVHLGPEEHLLSPGSDNPRGYWENQPIYRLNQRILTRLGGDWRKPPCFPPGWQRAPGLEDLRQEARAVIASDFGDAPVWGWKDPRTCLTLPFWQNLLPAMRYVICSRHPHSVARSLERRNSNFPLERGVWLWAAYLKSALASTRDEPRVFVSYEKVMSDWRPAVRALSSFLGDSHRAEDPALEETVRDFISPDLRHHVATEGWLKEVRPEAAEAFGLAREVHEALAEGETAKTSGLEQELQAVLDLLAPEVRKRMTRKPKWFLRRDRTREDLAALIPDGESFVLLDQGECELEIDARRRLRFPEPEAVNGGLLPDDDAAIGEVERLRRSGAGFLAVAWPAFWWLDYYSGLNLHLRGRYRCLLDNGRVVVFDLRSEVPQGVGAGS